MVKTLAKNLVKNLTKNIDLYFVFFTVVFGGPGGFRKVREVIWKNFLLVSSRSDLMVPSYGQKTMKGLIGGLGPFKKVFNGFKGLRGL